MGKGEYYRSAAKPYVSGCLNLDIRMLRQKGMLYNHATFTWSWTSRSGKSSISCRVSPDCESIALSYTKNDEPLSYNVQLDRTPCNYGGHRFWFLCLDCGKRIGVIYSSGKRFVCRKCSNLNYASSQECGNWNNEAIRRLRRIQAKLNCKEWSPMDCIYKTPLRPKGMHYRTYERLLHVYKESVIDYSRSFHAGFEKYERTL